MVKIVDLDIMDVCSSDELKTDTSTIIPTDSMKEKNNKDFIRKLEQKCAKIGMERCTCSPEERSVITGEIKVLDEFDQVNSYSYHALCEQQADVYVNDQALIRHCKKCGKNTFYGNPMLMLAGVSMFYNAMVSFNEMEITEEEIPDSEEIVEEPIAETCTASTCAGCTNPCKNGLDEVVGYIEPVSSESEVIENGEAEG